MKQYRFVGRHADGRVCCASDDGKYLCPRHRAQPTVAAAPQARTAVPALDPATINPDCTLHGHLARKTPAQWTAYWSQKLGVTLPSESPDPYRAATAKAPRRVQPSDDPTYQPYGQPPDGYALALQRQTVTR